MRLCELSLLLCTSAAAGECIVVDSGTVLVSDLASRYEELAVAPPLQVVMLAPDIGVKRWVAPVERDRIWKKLGLPQSIADGFCVERKSRLPDAALLLPALRRSFPDSVQIEIVEFSRFPISEGDVEFPAAGLHASRLTRPDQVVLWRGRSRDKAGRSQPVWVRVRLRETRRVTVTRRDIPAGYKLTADDLEELTRDVFPLEPMAAAAEHWAGKIAKQRMTAGQVLTPATLATPYAVTAGSIVDTTVFNSGVHLRLSAIAESNGRAGDLIWLKQVANTRKFKARISGPDKAVVEIGTNEPDSYTARPRLTNRIR